MLFFQRLPFSIMDVDTELTGAVLCVVDVRSTIQNTPAPSVTCGIALSLATRHTLRCTGPFARSSVVEEMRDMQVTKESQQHMVEALKRVRMDEDGGSIFDDGTLSDEVMENDDDDDAPGTIFSETILKLIAEGGDISVDDLYVEERKGFLQALGGRRSVISFSRGTRGGSIPVWNRVYHKAWYKPDSACKSFRGTERKARKIRCIQSHTQ